MQFPTTIKKCHELLQEQQKLILELKVMKVSMSFRFKDPENQLNQNSRDRHRPPSSDSYRNKPALGGNPQELRGRKLCQGGNTYKLIDTVDNRQKNYPLLYAGHHSSHQKLFHNLYGHQLNGATIQAATQNLHVKVQTTELHIRQLVDQRPVVHFDETGQEVAGKLNWLHVTSTENLKYLFAHPYCDSKAQGSNKSALSSYIGMADHDSLPVYLTNLVSLHTMCGAHLLRELTALKEQGSHWAEQTHKLGQSFVLQLAVGGYLNSYQN